MTTNPVPARQAPALGVRLTLVDGLTIVGRNLLKLRHSPGQIAGTFAFPLVSVVLFGYVLGSAIPIPGGGDYREYLMPGLFTMATVMGLMGSLTVIAKDNGLGVMDRVPLHAHGPIRRPLRTNRGRSDRGHRQHGHHGRVWAAVRLARPPRHLRHPCRVRTPPAAAVRGRLGRRVPRIVVQGRGDRRQDRAPDDARDHDL